jgi:hypothetical protein
MARIDVWKRWLGRGRNRMKEAARAKGPSPTGLAPIELSPTQWDQVEMTLAGFLVDSTSICAHARGRAGRAYALPLCFEWTAFMALRLDGRVVSVPYEDEPGEIEVIEDERLRNLGLFQGTKRHPDLAFLIPRRPADAVDCPDCGGTGKLTFPSGSEHLSERILCSCGGVGWLPRNVKP